MRGGEVPPEPVTEKVSVKHCVARDAATPVDVLTDPARTLKLEAVRVLGPAITNVLMSIRSWKDNFLLKL